MIQFYGDIFTRTGGTLRTGYLSRYQFSKGVHGKGAWVGEGSCRMKRANVGVLVPIGRCIKVISTFLTCRLIL